jgi:hypothetical protein
MPQPSRPVKPAHKSRDAWVRIASSVQSWGGRQLILECAIRRDCTLEAMRTQVFANQCIDTCLLGSSSRLHVRGY